MSKVAPKIGQIVGYRDEDDTLRPGLVLLAIDDGTGNKIGVMIISTDPALNTSTGRAAQPVVAMHHPGAGVGWFVPTEAQLAEWAGK